MKTIPTVSNSFLNCGIETILHKKGAGTHKEPFLLSPIENRKGFSNRASQYHRSQ